jgi:hypothetical protein
MALVWNDSSSVDGPPEKTRRAVQAQVRANFAKRAPKLRKPGPATRDLDRSMKAFPTGGEDLHALSLQQRLRLEALHRQVVQEQEEFARRMKAAHARHRTGKPKAHGKHVGIVLVPRCLTPPYSTSVSFNTVIFADGFKERDGALPSQPNGQSTFADTANGVAGQTTVWECQDTAALDVTRGVLIGGWIRAGNTTPLFLDARLTRFDVTPPDQGNGGEVDGWSYTFGGGIATYQLFIELFVFADTAHATSNPPGPIMNARVPVIDLSWAPITPLSRFPVPAGTRFVSGVAGTVSPGTWLLVLAGPVVHYFANIWHSQWRMGIDTTWSVDKICGYW